MAVAVAPEINYEVTNAYIIKTLPSVNDVPQYIIGLTLRTYECECYVKDSTPVYHTIPYTFVTSAVSQGKDDLWKYLNTKYLNGEFPNIPAPPQS